MSTGPTTITINLTLGERIRYVRERAGLKQRDLAEILHIGRATLANWENDVNKPSFVHAERIAQIGNMPVEFFHVGGFTASITSANDGGQQRVQASELRPSSVAA